MVIDLTTKYRKIPPNETISEDFESSAGILSSKRLLINARPPTGTKCPEMVNVFQEILRNYPTRTSKNCGTPNYRMDLGTSDLPTHATFHGAFRSAVRFLPLLNNIYALSPVGLGHFIDRYLGISLKEVIAAAAIIELKSHLLPRKSNTLSAT